jgi:hypothetical protein
MTADNMCCTLLLWGIFYIAIVLLSFTGPEQYIPDSFLETICRPSENKTEIHCTVCKEFDPNSVPSFGVQIKMHLNKVSALSNYNPRKQDLYDQQIKIKIPPREKKTVKLSEISDIKVLPYHLALLGDKQKNHSTSCSIISQASL